MRQKFFLAVIAIFCIQAVSFAQRPVRKGVKPVKVHEVVYEDAPPLYDVNKLNGKWLEMKRTNINGNPVSFSDSLMLTINNGKGFVKSAGSMDIVMKGDVIIERGNVMSVAGSNYLIQQADASSLTVKDGDMIKMLKPVDHFSFEEQRTAIKQESLNTPVTSSAKALEGKWQVYKKQAPPGFITETTSLIKWINFSDINGESGYGSMVVYDGSKKTEEIKFTFTLSGGTLTLKSYKGDTVYSVYKSDAEEFVFGKNGEVMNYAKR